MEAEESYQFRLYNFLNGNPPNQLHFLVGQIPWNVAEQMNWQSTGVYLSRLDVQKMRFHSQHGLPANECAELRNVVETADYYFHPKRGSDLQIELVRHNPLDPKRAFFAVLAMDKDGKRIGFRTFYKTTNLTRSKLRLSYCLLHQSGVRYFKEE